MKIIKTIILLLVLAGMTMSAHAQETDANQNDTTAKYTVRRNPLGAALLSAVTLGFGGGQYYNKQYVKAGILTAINTGTIIWAIAHDEGDGFLAGLEEVAVILLGMAVTLTYSVIDAPISAAAINKKYGLGKKISFSPSLERNQWDTQAVNVGIKLKLQID